MYTEEEMVIFSIIYSDYTKEQYPREKADHELLFESFKLSLEYEESFFDEQIREKLLVKSVENLQRKNPRKDYGKRCEELKKYFENFTYEIYMKKAEKEIALAQENSIKIITYLSDKYPQHLKNIKIPPFVLYVKGLFPQKKEFERSIAIIGSRKMDKKYGKNLALKLGEYLLENAWYNISGLALGCDEYGHIGSMGATGAVLGQGLCTPVFPCENTQLARDIVDNDGFLLSELPPSTQPAGHFLILRDRLQSGLTKGVIVVETSINGGTLHTVKYALEQKRKVFVMDMSHITVVENEEVIKGNRALLDCNLSMGSINIPKKERKRIIGIKKIKDLDRYLEKLGTASFSEKIQNRKLIQKTLL